MPSVAQNQIILQGLISNPAQIPNCEAWYDLSDANARITTTANFTGTGTATSTLISTAFVGVATAFLSELAPGDSVYNGSAVLIGVILSVTNDTNAVLTANGAAAITGAAFQISKANPRIILLKDKSGNSEVNVLAMQVEATSDRAYLTSGYSTGTGAFTAIFDILIPLANPTNNLGVGGLSSANAGALIASGFNVRLSSGGALVFFIFGAGGAADQNNATISGVVTSYSGKRITVTFVRNAAGNPSIYINGVVQSPSFSTAGTPPTWQGSVTSTFAVFGNEGGASYSAPIFNSRVYSVALDATGALADYSGVIQANIVVNSAFGLAAKLVSSFTAISGQTVTISSTGDLGARICGARDRVQLTPGKQRTLVGSGASVYALADGQNDYDKSAPFPLTQPASFYWVGQQKTWVSGAYIFDGATANSGAIIQTTSTPQLNLNAGSSVSANTGLAVATYGILTAIFNGALSFLGVNNATAVGGNAGAGTMNGITGSASGTPGNYGNTQEQEMVVYSVAHDVSAGNRIRRFLSRKWNIALGA